MRNRRITTALLLACLLIAVLSSACLADPQRAQTADLLDRLTEVHGMLGQNPPPPDACIAVGDIETRLYGEPGLINVQPAWDDLANAAHALQAVCGQDALLAQPITGSVELEAARSRWQQGIQRELGVACDHLRAAATALDRAAPC